MIIYIAIAIVSFLVGFLFCSFVVSSNFRRNPDAFIDALIERRRDLIRLNPLASGIDAISLYVIKDGNTYFVYEQATDKFVTQNTDQAAAINAAQELYPNKSMLINMDALYPELVDATPEERRKIADEIQRLLEK
jgi:hypothetical protein